MRQEPTFLVCGEALIDVFAADAGPEPWRLGGSPFNVAIGLARMSQSVAFLGAVSTDEMGKRLMGALEKEGVDTSCVVRTDVPTTQVSVRVSADGVPHYAVSADDGADRHLGMSVLAHLPAVRAIHVGSYAMVVEPIASTLRALIDGARPRALVVWDPNVRRLFVDDLARWRELWDWMLPRVDVLKVSAEDLSLLFPGRSIEDCARSARDAGVPVVIVTLGAAGARGWTANANVAVGMGGIPVVDTVGAGDAFGAALLARLAERACLDPAAIRAMGAGVLGDAMGRATFAATLTCSRRGADLPYRDDLRTGILFHVLRTLRRTLWGGR